MKIWVKKRTGKLVPVEVRPDEALKEVVPLAKVSSRRVRSTSGRARVLVD